MTVTLTRHLREVAESLKSGKIDLEESGIREHLGTLKRLGIVTNERDEDGDNWTLTDEGKAELKRKPEPEPAPEDDEPEPDDDESESSPKRGTRRTVR